MLLQVPILPFPARPPTRTACDAARHLGIVIAQIEPRHAQSTLTIPLHSPARVLITGPSGSGKTRLLRSAERALNQAGIRAVLPTPAPHDLRPCLESVAPNAGIEEAMHALARAGLADASVLLRRNAELSAGQAERLRLARAMHKAARAANQTSAPADTPRAAIIIDEFGATLDDETLASVSRLLQAHTRRHPATAVVLATHRAAVKDYFAPTIFITLDEAGRATVTAPHGASALHAPDFEITEGTTADHNALARHHYRTRPPATIDRVFRATESPTGTLVGVLTLSRPTLNAAWRRYAWPGRYDTRDKRTNAQRLNAEIRCISRVIVAPPFRALGAATALVRHALHHSPTRAVEALAALGGVGRVFAGAGMTEYPVPASPPDVRLLDLLHDADIEPWRLATPDAALARAVESLGTHTLESELRRWASNSRCTRASRAAPLPELFNKACRRLAMSKRAYAWRRPD